MLGGPALHNSPRLCHKRELDQKQTEGKGASESEAKVVLRRDVTSCSASMREKTLGERS